MLFVIGLPFAIEAVDDAVNVMLALGLLTIFFPRTTVSVVEMALFSSCCWCLVVNCNTVALGAGHGLPFASGCPRVSITWPFGRYTLCHFLSGAPGSLGKLISHILFGTMPNALKHTPAIILTSTLAQ